MPQNMLIGVILFLLTKTADSSGSPEPGFATSVSSSSSLRDVVTYLIADDTRLVRHNVTELTAERQKTEACTTHLEKAYQILLEKHVDDDEKSFVFDNSTSDVVVDALNVISLCSLDNAEHRSKFSSSDYTLLKAGALTSLITVNINPARTAAAAECMFALAKNRQSNQEALLKAGAVEALSSLFKYWDCDSTGTAVRAHCWTSTMWSVAALSRLSDAYCWNDEEDGECSWEWRTSLTPNRFDEIMEEDGRHLIFTEYDIRYDAKPVRLQLMRDLELMHSLDDYICDQAKFEVYKPPSERAWPTRIQASEASSAIVDAPIVVWAALWLLQSMSLSPGLYERLPKHLLDCLCEIVLYDPDWMERFSADDIMYRLGLDIDEHCFSVTDSEHCTDFDDWKDAENEYACESYEEDFLCVEYGALEDANGVSANAACCVCGGGHRIEDETVQTREVPSENEAPAIPSQDDDETDDDEDEDDDETEDDEQQGQHDEL